MSYKERLREFFRLNEAKAFPASAQLIYIHLLNLKESNGGNGRFYCPDYRLKELTSLSADSITRGKRILKNSGLIDFKTDKKNPHGGTLYIISEKTPSAVQVVADKNKIATASDEVLNAWERYSGERLEGGKILGLMECEKRHGTEKVIDAIIIASQSNDYGRYSKFKYNFFVKVLEDQVRFETSRAPLSDYSKTDSPPLRDYDK